MAADIMIMELCLCTALEFSKMQDQILLMLHWHSFSGGGSNIVAVLCAYQDGQYCDYGVILLCSPVIIQDARPEISDAPLTLIARMGQ